MPLDLLNRVHLSDVFKTRWKVTILPTQHLLLQSSLSYAVILELLRLICNSLSTFKLTAYAPFDHKMTLLFLKRRHWTFSTCPTCNKLQLTAQKWNLFSEKQVWTFLIISFQLRFNRRKFIVLNKKFPENGTVYLNILLEFEKKQKLWQDVQCNKQECGRKPDVCEWTTLR